MLMERRHEFVGTALEKAFWNSVSLEAFHMTQNEAMRDNSGETLIMLEKAYEASQKGLSREWESYVKGTLCYFKNDIEGLKREIPNSGDNQITLRRLLNGLLERGAADYKRDY